MCGRFVNHVQNMRAWREVLKDWPGEYITGYNIAPTQQVPVVYKGGIAAMRWGLIPAWSKSLSTKCATFNARLETVSDKPSFKGAWQRRQYCLVPALGYYEWLRENASESVANQPFFVTHAANEPLVMAGLWESHDAGYSFTILTEPASEHMATIHPRMPVVLPLEHAANWLDGDVRAMEDDISQQQERVPLMYFKVGAGVNSVRNQGPDLIEPFEDKDPFELDLFE